MDAHWLNIYRRAKPETAAFAAGLKAFFDIPTSKSGTFMVLEFVALRKVYLDLIALEEWLRASKGYDDSLSLRDWVAKQYGNEAVAFVLRFI